MELNAIKNLENVHLYQQAEKLNSKVKAGTEEECDHQLLENLSKQFDGLHKIKESLFCKKLLVKILYQSYWKTSNLTEGIIILEKAHDDAMDLVAYGEAKKAVAPSFYKALLNVKIELANAKRSIGLLDEAIALEVCARRICGKAQKLFPTYQNFPSQLIMK